MNAVALPPPQKVSPPLNLNGPLRRFCAQIRTRMRKGAADEVRTARRRAALAVVEAVLHGEDMDTIRGFEAVLNGCLDIGYRAQPLAAFVFDALHRRLAARVRRRMLRSGRDADSPEVADLVASTAVAIQKLIRGANREQHDLRYALLLSIADHRTIDFLRRRRPEYRESMDDPALALRGDNPEARVSRLQRKVLACALRDAVLDAHNALPARERTALILVEIEGQGYDEVAQALSVKRTDVGNVVRRARLQRDRLLVPRLRTIKGLEGHVGFQGMQADRELRCKMLMWSADVGEGICPHCVGQYHLHPAEQDCAAGF